MLEIQFWDNYNAEIQNVYNYMATYIFEKKNFVKRINKKIISALIITRCMKYTDN